MGHTLAFATWRSLAIHEGLTDDQAADLMAELVTVAEGRPDTRPRPISN